MLLRGGKVRQARLTESAPSPNLSYPYLLNRNGHMLLAYQLLDVFTDTPFSGNQLALVPRADHVKEADMARIAREFGFSETVFLQTPESQRNAARVRSHLHVGDLHCRNSLLSVISLDPASIINSGLWKTSKSIIQSVLFYGNWGKERLHF